MSFLADLRRELARNGIRGGLARRIELELADHLACDPHASLGAPAEIAERFAVELRVVRTRRAAIATFGALALSGSLLCLSVLAIAPAGGTHGGAPRSLVAPFSGLGMIAFGQIAFVAGLLALVRGLRPRGVADLGLAQRRAVVALFAGGLASVCLAANALAAPEMPVWWRALALASGLLPLPALGGALEATRAAAAITPDSGCAAALEGDLPGPFGMHPGAVLAALGGVAVSFVVLQGVFGEGSLVEGLVRGAIEATGLIVAVLLLGRVLGLRR